jgi:hypothetical protein
MIARSYSHVLTTFGTVVLVYFVIYPDDVKAVLAPLRSSLEFSASLLGLSHAVSPWLYLVIAVTIVTWGGVRVWGRTETGR